MSRHAASPTPYPELNEVLAAFLAEVRAALGDNLLGVYLQGSFALGDFDEYSDCDWIVATREDVAAAQVPGLRRMHERIHALPSPWAQHLEGSYFPASRLRAPDPGGERPLLYLDNGSRVLERSTHDDTLVVRWTLREHGIVLAGPALDTLVDPVDGEALRDEVRGFLRTWSASLVGDPSAAMPRWLPPFAVVSHCRFLYTLHAGAVASKPVACAWARGRLDPGWQPLIDRVVARRPWVHADPHAPADPADVADALLFVRYATRLAAQAYPSDSPRSFP